jgi:ferric-dicitrate binding protein FerR (iron transport regulator)
MMDAEKAAGLLFRYVRKELTREEERQLTNWRYLSPENEQLFQEKTDRTRILAELGRRLEKNKQLKKDIDHYFSEDPGKWPHKYHLGRFRVSRIAAACLLVLVSGLFILFDLVLKSAHHFEATLVDPEGIKTGLDDFHRGLKTGLTGVRYVKEKNGDLVFVAVSEPGAAMDKYFELYTSKGLFYLRLPDNSKVWLNQNSEIRYPANFSGDSIRIYIKGEVFFEMPSQSKTSLLITAFPVTVHAPGAQIDVSAYPEERATKITLLKGSAHIYSEPHTGNSDSAVPLLSGQEVRWENGKFSNPAPVNVEQVMRWWK